MRILKSLFLVSACTALLAGCAKTPEATDITNTNIESEVITEESSPDSEEVIAPVIEEEAEPSLSLSFVDAHGEYHETTIKPISNPCLYDKNMFEFRNRRMTYAGEGYDYRIGIDVSYFQENIDWERVKADGVEFVFIRVGFRGYGEEGTLNIDPAFHENIQGAQAAGLEVGVYFFAQAIDEEEAIEEANFVLKELEGYELQMPVVYDPETIRHTEARTDNVTKEQFTKNTLAFCKTIEEAGYNPMIYCNLLWQVFHLEMSDLQHIPVWYADYEYSPQSPYHFEIWQYTQTGEVDGIEGDVDINLQLIPKE